MGGENFQTLIISGTPEEIDRKLSVIPPEKTIPEMWCVQIYARILQTYKVILVTTFLDHDLIRKANMIPASSLDEALRIAYEIKGKAASVAVIPDGVSVLAVKE
jgi:nickel-dependent lactate racemase